MAQEFKAKNNSSKGGKMKSDNQKNGKFQNGKSSKGKKQTNNSSNIKPWEQKQKAQPKKPIREFKSFLYLMPGKVSVSEMAKKLEFIPREQIEVWEEEGVLEITVSDNAITFENIMESMDREDEKVLQKLGQKVVLACDYEIKDRETVQKIMEVLLNNYEGKIGSDTEDFEPFMEINEI